MDIETLEKIKKDFEMLRENVIQYLTIERNIFDESDLIEKDTYDLFALFLTAFLPRLDRDVKKEASCLPAAITRQLAMSLGWMDEHFNLLSKDFMGITWGRRPDGGTYTRFTYTEEEQKEIWSYLSASNII